jgi:tRNA modification GTPase
MPVKTATTAAVLTPSGRGAIATIRVSGARAMSIVSELLQTGSRPALANRPARTIVFGRWGDEAGEELVASCLHAEQVEIHCHGGVAAVARIVADLERCGCEVQPWQNDARQNDHAPQQSYWQREALIALAAARTERTAGILLDQFGGAGDCAVQQILSLLEAGDRTSAQQSLDELLARATLGLHLVNPWSVVLAGRPNVGKSSLINALLGYERAIVFDTPGTTRDIVSATTACDGWPITLSDTAGWRDEAGEIESQGIAAAKAAASRADLVVIVVDRSQSWSAADEALCAACPAGLLVWNKSDLPASATTSARPGIHVSAKTGEGLAELLASIGQRLVPNIPPPGVAVPFVPEQLKSLTAASAAAHSNDLDAARQELRRLLSS